MFCNKVNAELMQEFPQQLVDHLRRILLHPMGDTGQPLHGQIPHIALGPVETNRVQRSIGALPDGRRDTPTPSCYAVTGWRRTESGRPAASIRFSTATPMAASVCCAAKPRSDQRLVAAYCRFN